jgi:hypothetical protein
MRTTANQPLPGMVVTVRAFSRRQDAYHPLDHHLDAALIERKR